MNIIHFLQDLILPYCIRANMVSIGQLACINMYANQHKELIRPFEEWNEDCKITQEQNEYIWGSGEFINKVNIIKNIYYDYKTITVIRGKEVDIDIYRYFIDTDQGFYHVGARDFLEYIAHKIEDQHWDTFAPEFPYKTVDKIFEYLGFYDIPTEVRICIIEYCLYNDNPVHMFFNIFIKMKLIENNKEEFLSYESCKNYLINLGWGAKGDFEETIFSKTKRRLNDFRDWLGTQYSHQQFSDIKNWVEHVSSYVEQNLSNRFIFSELYNLSAEELDLYINYTVQEIGIPIVFNNRHKCISLLPDGYDCEQFLQFFTMLGFMRYVCSEIDECPVAEYCKESSPLYDEGVCLKNPLSTVNREEVCPFALFLKSYGYHTVTFKK